MRNPKRDPLGPLKSVPGIIRRDAVIGTWDAVRYRLDPTELVGCTLADLPSGTAVTFSPAGGQWPIARRVTIDG